MYSDPEVNRKLGLLHALLALSGAVPSVQVGGRAVQQLLPVATLPPQVTDQVTRPGASAPHIAHSAAAAAAVSMHRAGAGAQARRADAALPKRHRLLGQRGRCGGRAGQDAARVS